MVKIEFEESAASNGDSTSKKCLWLCIAFGALGNFALWHARGTDAEKYGKFTVTNFLAVSLGAGGTYSTMFYLVPASYSYCVDPAQEAQFELYRGWFRDHHQSAMLNGTPPSPPSSPTGPTTLTRKKRSISSAVNRTSPATMMNSVATRTYPAATSEPTNSVDYSFYPTTPAEQAEESNNMYKHNVDISIHKADSLLDARHLAIVVLVVIYGNFIQLALFAVVVAIIYDGLKKAVMNRALASEDNRSTEMSTTFGRWDSRDAAIEETGIYMECRSTPTFLSGPPEPPMRNMRNTTV